MEERDGPLPALLLVLTAITGMVDAVSYLELGRVFVGNMTGNVVFLGFAAGGAPDFSVSASIAALAAFLVGAFAGGTIGPKVGDHRARVLAIAAGLEIVLVDAALAVSMAGLDSGGGLVRNAVVVLLALAMGVQNAAARRLGVRDLNTTVLTLTLTGLAADSPLAGAKNPRRGRRVLATATMFLGAAIGTFLVFEAGVDAVLALVSALLITVCVASGRHWRSPDEWTAGAHAR
jgi:uncharacterized membrane protein YoaK (UPF0700 family)